MNKPEAISTAVPPSILVVGSSNTDMVIKAPHLPLPGETILGGSFLMNAGGKGANQAVAAARLGGNVTLIAKTGSDIFGRQSKEHFENEGINTSFMCVDHNHPSGVALITVDNNGENCIVVASGANATLAPADLESALEQLKNSSVLLMQLEIPVSTVEFVSQFAASNGIRVVLNPAPVCKLPDQLLRYISVLTPNEIEAEMLSGIQISDLNSAATAARLIRDRGVQTVIITMGSKGALLLDNDVCTLVPAPAVTAVDTTAAGDIFNGALAVALATNKAMEEAVSFACRAAAISVTRLGAQLSAPYKHEMEDMPMVPGSP